MKKTILFATKNKGKAYELSQILNSVEIDLKLLTDFPNIPDVPEIGETFIANARLKANAIYKHFRLPVFADDSGLSVDCLNGEPGVYSARYAGENASDQENNDKLLDSVKPIPPPYKAKFVCAALYYDGHKEYYALGEMPGQIVMVPRGKNGFGYDPLFVPEGYDRTTAELTDEEKNAVSHRGIAFRSLCSILRDQGIIP